MRRHFTDFHFKRKKPRNGNKSGRVVERLDKWNKNVNLDELLITKQKLHFFDKHAHFSAEAERA